MDLTALTIDLAGVYARNGYLVGPLLSPTQVMRIAEISWCYLRSTGTADSEHACCRFRAGHAAPRQRDESEPQEPPQPGRLATPVRVGDVAQQVPAIAQAALDSETLFLAADLTGAAGVTLVGSALLYQPANSTAPPRHQPGAGHPYLESDITAVIAIDDQFDDGGCLRLHPVSHLGGTRQDAEQTVPLPAGWVAMLHPRLRYAQAANTSDTPRRCLVLDYAATAPRTGG